MQKEFKGIGDQLYIYKMLNKERKEGNKNLAMRWNNYQKANDMFLHSWVIESLNMMEGFS